MLISRKLIPYTTHWQSVNMTWIYSFLISLWIRGLHPVSQHWCLCVTVIPTTYPVCYQESVWNVARESRFTNYFWESYSWECASWGKYLRFWGKFIIQMDICLFLTTFLLICKQSHFWWKFWFFFFSFTYYILANNNLVRLCDLHLQDLLLYCIHLLWRFLSEIVHDSVSNWRKLPLIHPVVTDICGWDPA